MDLFLIGPLIGFSISGFLVIIMFEIYKLLSRKKIVDHPYLLGCLFSLVIGIPMYMFIFMRKGGGEERIGQMLLGMMMLIGILPAGLLVAFIYNISKKEKVDS
jgi:hypothetical protein